MSALVVLLLSLTLNESPAWLTAHLGTNPEVRKGAAHRVYEFHTEREHDCNSSPEWTFYYDADGRLLSATLNAELNRTEFPLRFSHGGATVLVKLLPGNRVLFAPVVKDAGDPGQLVLMRREAIGRFLPWLDEELQGY